MLQETVVTAFGTSVRRQPGGLEAYSVSGSTAPLILNFGTRLRQVVNTPGPLDQLPLPEKKIQVQSTTVLLKM